MVGKGNWASHGLAGNESESSRTEHYCHQQSTKHIWIVELQSAFMHCPSGALQIRAVPFWICLGVLDYWLVLQESLGSGANSARLVLVQCEEAGDVLAACVFPVGVSHLS